MENQNTENKGQNNNVKFCVNCGNQIASNADFCVKCGAQIISSVPADQQQNVHPLPNYYVQGINLSTIKINGRLEGLVTVWEVLMIICLVITGIGLIIILTGSKDAGVEVATGGALSSFFSYVNYILFSAIRDIYKAIVR